MVNLHLTNANIELTGNLKFDVVGDNIILSNYDNNYVSLLDYNRYAITTDFKTDIQKYYYNRDNTTNYNLSDKSVLVPSGPADNLKYYRTDTTTRSYKTSFQIDFSNPPTHFIILENKRQKYRSESYVPVVADFKESNIIYTFEFSRIMPYLETLFTNKMNSNVNYDSTGQTDTIYGLNPKTGKYVQYDLTKKYTIDGDDVIDTVFDDDSYITKLKELELITTNTFNFEFFFDDDSEFTDYQGMLIQADTICTTDINYEAFSKRYNIPFTEYNIDFNSVLDTVIPTEVTLNTSYESIEPILSTDYKYVLDDIDGNLITIKEKFFDLLTLKTKNLKLNQLFGNSKTNDSIYGYKNQEFIPSNLVLTILNNTNTILNNGDYFSVTPSYLNDNIEYRVIARNDLNYDSYIPYHQHKKTIIFQTNDFLITDYTTDLDANSSRDNVHYKIEVNVEDYVDIDEHQPIRIKFGMVDVFTNIYNLRKNPETNTTSFDLYDYGDLNFKDAKNNDYELLKFEYKEKPYHFTYFNSNVAPNQLVINITNAFNSFENIFVTAVAYKNNIIFKSNFDDDSWNKIKLRYNFTAYTNLSNFQINTVGLKGTQIKHNDTILYITKINDVNFTSAIRGEKTTYSIGNSEKNKLNNNTYIYTKLGKDSVNMTSVDGEIALPKNVNNMESLDNDVLTIVSNNDEYKTVNTNYVGLSNKFKPTISKIIQIGGI